MGVSWTIEKAECWRIDAFELWGWRKLLRVSWAARRTNQSVLIESTVNIYWKDWCWSWSSNTLATWCEEPALWKNSDAGKDWRQKEKGTAEDEVDKQHHWLNGHELEQLWEILKQCSRGCCSPWGHKVWTRLSEWTTTKKCLKPVDTKFCRRTLQHYVTERSGILILNLFYKEKNNELPRSETEHFGPMT